MSSYSVTHPKIGATPPRPHTGADTHDSERSSTEPDWDSPEFGPTRAARAEWQAQGLALPDLPRMRRTRLDRVLAQLQTQDLAGVLLFDPLNIRYATDSSNMQLWTAHNPARAAFVAASGHVVLWDFHGCDHLSAHLNLVNEVRHGAGFFYFLAGDREEDLAHTFASEVDALMRAHAGNNRRLAVDRIEWAGARALESLGVALHSGQRVMEHARVVKSIDEVNAMRCAIATCEAAMQAMQARLEPGIAEVELWSTLHAENIRRGGEWIETRILASGPRTNPWMQEAGGREVRDGELLAFDTDLVGPYGMCADLSRTWYCGDGVPSGEQRHLYQVAHDHIMSNQTLLGPGVAFRELAEKLKPLPQQYRAQRYGCAMHGVGLCDEFPVILYPEDYMHGAFDYVTEPGMVFCVEVYVGAVGGHEGVKLEQQLLITDTGSEDLCQFPFDDRLLG